MYDRILLPTDGSAGMADVVDHAGALAAAHGATVHLLYVVDAGGFAGLPMETSWESVSELLHEEGRAALDAAERRLDGNVPVERATVEGSPSREIVAYADEHDCDLVVMGTHGRGGLDRILLGSVAERVVRTAEVPVFTVRVGPTGERSDDAASEDAPDSENREPTPGPS